VAAGANILDPHTRQPEDDKDIAARSELAFYYVGQKNDVASISEYLRPAACVDPIGARGAETALAYLNPVTLRHLRDSDVQYHREDSCRKLLHFRRQCG